IMVLVAFLSVVFCLNQTTDYDIVLRIPSEPLFFFFKQKTAYEIGLGIPAEPLFRSLTSFPVRRAIMFMLVSWFGLTLPLLNAADWRSEERRVGKECRSGWVAYY